MDPIAIGFWGAFFGSAVLMLAGSALLLLRAMRWAAWIGGVSAAVPLLYALAFLGWLGPADLDARDRLLAHVGVLCGVALCVMLLALLGQLRQRRISRIARIALLSLGASGALVLLGSWLLSPQDGLFLSCVYCLGLGAAMTGMSLRYAAGRQQVAVQAIAGVACIVIGQLSLSAIALLRGAVPWPVHALGAGAGVAYMAIVASALWLRVLRAIELREVMALGPGYDTITRMHAYTEAGKVVAAYFRKAGAAQAVGVVAVSVANLRGLERLHGRAAHNHAVFVCASRLRSCAPLGAELCRVGEDGFLVLVLMRDPQETQLLTQLARQVRRRLLRPIALGTGTEASADGGERMEWLPEVGVGIATSGQDVTPGNAVVTARTISRTAWGFGSRMAFRDVTKSEVSELPVEATQSTGGE